MTPVPVVQARNTKTATAATNNRAPSHKNSVRLRRDAVFVSPSPSSSPSPSLPQKSEIKNLKKAKRNTSKKRNEKPQKSETDYLKKAK
jgi:hypothetical protein